MVSFTNSNKLMQQGDHEGAVQVAGEKQKEKILGQKAGRHEPGCCGEDLSALGDVNWENYWNNLAPNFGWLHGHWDVL